jgi:hypothetical protein
MAGTGAKANMANRASHMIGLVTNIDLMMFSSLAGRS